MVSIDLVLGCPKTPRGHIGICVMVEHLTGYCYAHPIKSKEAKEIVKILWTWVSIFGPMKKLLSDQGTEFLNNIIDEFLNLIGTERKVTSSYHPECNGRTERLNQTLVRSLRKHCEQDPSNWDQFISFITFAYNTRVHSITGVSPYTGVFGILANHFEDYDKQSESTLTQQRNIQRVQELIESTHPMIKSRRNEFAIKQKRNQDNSHSVATEPFNVGDLVTIKSMKIQGKLQPKYNGIFKIASITSHGNYILENNDGETLKYSFLHSRLKKVNNDINLDNDQETIDVIEIIKHRTQNRQLEYLVKFSNDSVSWEPEYYFDTTDLIDAYWNSFETNNNDNNRNSTNLLILFAQAFKLINKLPILIIFGLCLLTICEAQSISHNFKLCDLGEAKQIWNIPNNCNIAPINKPNQANNNYYILSKTLNEFDTLATVCSMKIIQVSTYVNFIGAKTLNKNEVTVHLNEDECNQMQVSKKCGHYPMKCDENNYCENIETPIIKYSWLQAESNTWPECQLYQKRLIAPTYKSKILLEESTTCYPLDLQCKQRNSIMVWSNHSVNICPYKVVRLINLDLFDNVLVSDMENKMFQITNEEKICDNIHVYNTAEGFQLTTDSKALQLESANSNIKIIDGLLLAEIDFNKRQIIELIVNIFQSSNSKLCQLFKSIANIYSKIDDEYFKINDFNGNEAILYSDQGLIYVPQCLNINQIEIINETKNCFKDIPIKTQIKNRTIIAFLTQDKIIRLFSKEQSCNNNKLTIHLNNKTIVKENNKVIIKNEEIHDKIDINIQWYNISKINHMVKHDEIIINSINLLNESFSLTTKNEIEGILHVMNDDKTDSTNIVSSLVDQVKEINESASDVFHKILLYALMVLTSAITTFICIAMSTRH